MKRTRIRRAKHHYIQMMYVRYIVGKAFIVKNKQPNQTNKQTNHRHFCRSLFFDTHVEGSY